MLITAYMDESGTHGSETMVMAAYAASADGWRKIEKKSSLLFSRYGVRVFHAKKWRDSDGDFKGWSVDKKIIFLDRFGEIINRNIIAGCHSVLRMSDYKKFYDTGDIDKSVRHTPYAVCFRAALSFMSQVAVQARPVDEPRSLNVVLEQGHKNAGDALRLFELLKESLLPQYRDLLGTMTFASKRECMPLAVPDAVALGIWREEEGLKKTMRPKKGMMRSERAYKNNHYRVAIEERALRSLKRELLPSL